MANAVTILYGCACSILVLTSLLSLPWSAASPQGRSLPLRFAQNIAFANTHVHTRIQSFCVSITAAWCMRPVTCEVLLKPLTALRAGGVMLPWVGHVIG